MASNTLPNQEQASEQPGSGTHKAAMQGGLTTVAFPIEELEVLRCLARAAAQTLESHDETGAADSIFQDALRSSRDDVAVIADAYAGGGALPAVILRRCELRMDLALALAEYHKNVGTDDAEGAK